jgi:16S rRNA (guanine527-N7)-methyltransferase
VTGHDAATQILEQSSEARIPLTTELADELAAYLALLAQWNRRINLTALDAASPSREAVERLILEPLAALAYVLPGDRHYLDVGSGGGSPAIPIKLARPELQLVMVESRARKAAFLSEAIRTLALVETRVEVGRFEDCAARGRLAPLADLATLRAVRADRALLKAIVSTVRPGGRLLWFGTNQEFEAAPMAEHKASRHQLLGQAESLIQVIER